MNHAVLSDKIKPYAKILKWVLPSKTCNIAATCFTFCDKQQQGMSLLLAKNVKHVAAILQVLDQFNFDLKILA